jgi:hypothetical protein
MSSWIDADMDNQPRGDDFDEDGLIMGIVVMVWKTHNNLVLGRGRRCSVDRRQGDAILN